MKSLSALFFVSVIFSLGFCMEGRAQESPDTKPLPATVLFQNVRIFDGKNSNLSEPSNVLVRGNIIETISKAPIPTDGRADTVLIEDGGRTLMPGLIDAHAHLTFNTLPIALLYDYLSVVIYPMEGVHIPHSPTSSTPHLSWAGLRVTALPQRLVSILWETLC